MMNNITTQEARQYLEDFYLSSQELLLQDLHIIKRTLERKQMLSAKFQEKVQQTETNEEIKQLIPVLNELKGNLQGFITFLSTCTGGYDEITVLKSPIKYLELERFPQNLLLLEQQIRTSIDAINSIKPVFDTKIFLKFLDEKIQGQINTLETMLPIFLFSFLLAFEESVLEHLLLHFF